MGAVDESADVGARVGRGALWGLLNTSVLRVASLASGIALARILSPDDYGVYAIALVALTLLQAFNELGVSLALVQWSGDVRRIAPTVMTVAVSASVLLYLVTWVGAPAFCAAMGSPDAVPVLRLLCLAVVVDGVATVPVGVLNRFFLQGRRFVGDTVSFVASTSVTITLAVAGAGALSFAWGSVVGALLATVVFTALSPVRVLPGWDRSVAPRLLRFGLPLAGSSLLVLSVSNVDNLVVGALTTQTALGLYLMAFNQSSWPLNVFAEAARRVALAGFSRLADDTEALTRAFARGLAVLMAVTVPVCVLLAGYAAPMLRFVYGAQWAPAAPALVLLALVGLLRVALFVVYDLFVALDRARRLVALQAVWLVALLPALVIGTRLDGIRGAAAAHLVVAALVVTPVFFLATARVGVRVGPALAACVRPLVGGLVVVVSVVAVRTLVAGDVWQLVVGGAVGLLVYAPVVWPMRRLLPSRGGTAPVPAPEGPPREGGLLAETPIGPGPTAGHHLALDDRPAPGGPR